MLKIIRVVFFLFIVSPGHAQTASFTYQSAGGLYCSPVAVQFTQTATGSPTAFLWNFGNGQISSSPNPNIVFNNAGTYSVQMTAVYADVGVKTSQTIVINQGITASLTANRNYICIAGPINFTAASNGNIASYEWDFGDGSPVTSTSSPINSHNYSSPGSYTSSLKVTDNSGCFATATSNVVLQSVPVSGSISRMEGCIPAAVNLNVSANIPAGSAVSNYQYNFGDGSPVLNSTAASVSHTYTGTAIYNPTVSVVTNEGCSSSYNFSPVAYGTPPTAINAYPDATVYCGSETPVFVATATNANRYFWNFGDGDTATLRDTITQHKYGSLGFKTITVSPFFNGCPGASASFQIEIIGVIASFNASNVCTAKNSFSFANTSEGNISSTSWTFGDNSPSVTTINAAHVYSSPGSYPATLIVVDNATGCSSSFTKAVHSGTSALTNPDTSICRNAKTLFTLSNNQSNPDALYSWNVAGLNVGPVPGKLFEPTASVFGNFTLNYVVIDNGPGYCKDTAYLNHRLGVRGPDLKFTAPGTICQNTLFTLVNNSKPFNPQDSVISWLWNFQFPTSIDSVSTYQPAPFNFPLGLYEAELIAKDKTGCVDSLGKYVTVNPAPFVQVIPRLDTLCMGQSDTLIAFHSDSLLWSPANLVSCTTCDTITVNPPVSTIVIATANNIYGCSTRDTASIRVYPRFTAQAVVSPLYICKGEGVNINVSPPGNVVTWTPPAGLSNSNGYNPIASPSQSTAYIATVTDSAGCFTSNATVNVMVKSLPVVNAGPDRTLPYNASFAISPVYSSNVRRYVWSPAGTLNCTGCPTPNGTALQAQNYVIQVTSDSGCVARDSINIFVECKYSNLLVPSAFTPNNDSQNDRYFPIARGIRIIKRFVIFNRLGQVLFEARDFKPNNPASGWDGSFRGQDQTMGTYVYWLEAICDVGGIITKKDAFLLIR